MSSFIEFFIEKEKKRKQDML